MSKTSAILLSVVIFLLVAVQSFIAWAWIRTDAIQQYVGIFQSFYPSVPKWSLIAFGTKSYCWAFPLVCALLYIVAIIWSRNLRTLAVMIISTAIAGGMVYAMYPLGQMPSVVMRTPEPNKRFMFAATGRPTPKELRSLFAS